MTGSGGWGFQSALLLSVLAVACANSSSAASTDAGTTGRDGGTPLAPDAKPPDPFTGDCSSARWSNASDSCWTCFCSTCKDTLNACNTDCVKGITCAGEKHALVGVSADLSCELRAFTALCSSDPAINAQATPLLNFDTCLISSHNPATEHLRACEAECGVTYTGDVCQRFPAPDGG